jgi:2-C-methyl-D-erythritol 4-phosphate cytidylyltransferase
MSVAVLVLAGGSGTRFGADRNKVYLPLAGRSVLSWSVNTLAGVPEVEVLVLVTRPSDREFVEVLLTGEVAAGVEVVAGGTSRQESELAGLRALADRIRAGTIDTVLIHDGARPLVSAELAAAVITAARRHGGAVPGVVRTDLAVAVDGERLTGGAAAGLVAVQTPQGFTAAPLLAAYEQAQRDGYGGTDTASCVQHYTDIPVYRVPGEQRNLKITYPHDLRIAEAVLRQGKCGG